MTQSPEMVAILARVRQRFDAMLAGRLATLDAALARVQDPAARHAALIEARTVLHHIAGSAGSLGLPRLGAEARACEQAIDGWISHGTPDWPRLREGIMGFAALARDAA